VLVASADAATRRENFFRIVFGDNEGYICISSRKAGKNDTFHDEFFLYPDTAENMLRYIEANVMTHDLWYCPMLFDTKKRTKEHVLICPVVWSDLDECNPKNLIIQPSITIASSPGRWQGLWRLDEPADPSDAEAVSKRIAYYHAEQGADKSGWDLTQLLRIPFTLNFKYGDSPPMVSISAVNQDPLTLESFDIYPQSDEYAKEEIPFPAEFPFEDGLAVLTAYKTKIHPNIWPMFSMPPPGDWSKTLWQMEMMLFESELTREEVFLIVKDAACNKYKRDGRSDKLLWRDVCRASARRTSKTSILISPNQDREPDPLLSPEEQAIADADVTIIEEYVEWAKTLGDAAWQYHEAGAFIILSSLLSGAIKLPTSFGIVTPNLWFMLLADTTLTRKTTAMDIAMEMLLDVDHDCVLATDGSIEGLFTSLSLRPNRASVFLRDEFSGLLEAMTKKDYMAGMAETLTKLYDGKYQKRVLRKEIIEVKDPILIILAGGIRSKIQQLLQFEHVSSGFMPRFLFVTATSDVTKMKPLGPPTRQSEGNRLEILNKLKELHLAVTMQHSVTIGGTVTLMNPRYDAELTPEAWERYNRLETEMVDLGLQSTMPEILMPMMDRLSKSGLKAAVLIAASRGVHGTKIVVELKDLIKAISYVEKWREYGIQVIRNIGMSMQERTIDQVYKAICRTPNILRSTIMQNYHLTKRDADVIMGTLEERGLITGVSHGRSIKYTPTKYHERKE
jgi:hypothetical protein